MRQCGLAEPGQIFDEQMPAGKQGDKRQPDFRHLAQHQCVDLILCLTQGLTQLIARTGNFSLVVDAGHSGQAGGGCAPAIVRRRGVLLAGRAASGCGLFRSARADRMAGTAGRGDRRPSRAGIATAVPGHRCAAAIAGGAHGHALVRQRGGLAGGQPYAVDAVVGDAGPAGGAGCADGAGGGDLPACRCAPAAQRGCIIGDEAGAGPDDRRPQPLPFHRRHRCRLHCIAGAATGPAHAGRSARMGCVGSGCTGLAAVAGMECRQSRCRPEVPGGRAASLDVRVERAVVPGDPADAGHADPVHGDVEGGAGRYPQRRRYARAMALLRPGGRCIHAGHFPARLLHRRRAHQFPLAAAGLPGAAGGGAGGAQRLATLAAPHRLVAGGRGHGAGLWLLPDGLHAIAARAAGRQQVLPAQFRRLAAAGRRRARRTAADAGGNARAGRQLQGRGRTGLPAGRR
ncbi:hypothetical protein G6F35_008751 [Rhizopus arrhizus]|nr:hypothetical protein G6F35_008751 [Rhizopus arrhizus]